MSRNGYLFIDEHVRDTVEQEEDEIISILRDNGYGFEVAEPTTQSFSSRNDPKRYPDEGEVLLCIFDDEERRAQVGRAAFTVEYNIVNDLGGARVEAHVGNLVTTWRRRVLEYILPDDALPESDVPSRYRSGPPPSETL